MVKKIFITASVLIFLATMIYSYGGIQKISFRQIFDFPQKIQAASSESVSGYAWSENIGWIKFNGLGYGVSVSSSNGNFSGYAWSENIGWINFNPNPPYPGSPNQSVKLDTSTNQITGWARACAGSPDSDCTGGVGANSNSGGWDGWIKMTGSGYGITRSSCQLQGYAWGSDVLGWIKFSGSGYGVTLSGETCSCVDSTWTPDVSTVCSGTSFTQTSNCGRTQTAIGTKSCPPSVDIKANSSDGPVTISYGDSATLSWTTVNITSCSASEDWHGSKSISGSEPTGSLTSSKTYTLNCTGPGGSASDTVRVNIPSPDFSLLHSDNISATVLRGRQGDSTESKITISSLGGFSSTVGLSVQSVSPSLPSGSSYNFSTSSLTSGQYSSGSQFSVHIGLGLESSQIYTITIKGVGGGLTRTIDIILNVQVRNPDWQEI